MPRILFLDAYDSFSNNIVSLVRAQLDATVELIRIDDERFALSDDALYAFLSTFDAVVAGPGPGHPAKAEDVGLIGRLWSLADRHLLPVLGVCLGFQSLCLAAGARVERLTEPRHGRIARLVHSGDSLFSGTVDAQVTLYHSLHVTLDLAADEKLPLWKPSSTCPSLQPLAWACEDAENGPILMAVRHCSKPFWGVQFHPESVCTNDAGARLIQNWWSEALTWRSSRKMQALVSAPPSASPSTLSWTSAPGTPEDVRENPDETAKQHFADDKGCALVMWSSWPISSGIDVDVLVEEIRDNENVQPVLLESGVRDGKPLNSETGRFSIIGVPHARTTEVKYYASTGTLERFGEDGENLQQCTGVQDVFEVLQEFMLQHKASDGPENLPFWGGLVGFVGYEAGLQTIDVTPSSPHADRPDLWFVFVDRSVVVDHVDNVAYVQSIRENDDEWVVATQARLSNLAPTKRSPPLDSIDAAEIISEPVETEYCQSVRACQYHLREGSSYELCLTDQTHVRNAKDPWSIYRTLRTANPAPFGCFLRFDGHQRSDSLAVAGSSPERFLSWSRDGLCQFRPIKGTVKKTPETSFADAAAILNSEKERAENLMIVDLIRHDLSGVAGVENVHVPKLMVIEEYETVYQLVSVIEGTMTADPSDLGIAVLARSLPPGSMTGAPKKRSCELLCELEHRQPRGLYSGVLGYFDVGGGGDFSVVIRTAFKWEKENFWRIGAGGAVTALSEDVAEWHEMKAKRERVLDVLKR